MKEQNKTYQLFRSLNEFYKRRNVDEVDKLYDQLFDDSLSPIVIGTSLSECFFSEKQIKNLFANDFKSWGDVEINLDSLTTQTYGSFVYAKIDAKLKMTFDVDQQTYESFKKEIIEVFKQGNEKANALETIWMLTHLLKDRDQGIRSYLWDLKLIAIVDESKEQAKIKLLHFYMPFHKNYYDIRLNISEREDFFFSKEANQLKDAYQKKNAQYIPAVKKEIEKVFKQRTDGFNTIEIDNESFNLHKKDDIILFSALGKMEQTFDFKIFSDHVLKHFKKQTSDAYKDHLFTLMRDLAYGLKEEAYGKKRVIAFRVVGVAVTKELEQPSVVTMDITYPYEIILENKTAYETRI